MFALLKPDAQPSLDQVHQTTGVEPRPQRLQELQGILMCSWGWKPLPRGLVPAEKLEVIIIDRGPHSHPLHPPKRQSDKGN